VLVDDLVERVAVFRDPVIGFAPALGWVDDDIAVVVAQLIGVGALSDAKVSPGRSSSGKSAGSTSSPAWGLSLMETVGRRG
jgi:hypothetical protein